jgi:hypothetical protein
VAEEPNTRRRCAKDEEEGQSGLGAVVVMGYWSVEEKGRVKGIKRESSAALRGLYAAKATARPVRPFYSARCGSRGSPIPCW